MVLALRQGGSEAAADEALSDLCRIYWRPLYVYARRQGNTPHDAEDLTQGFMELALKRSLLAQADQNVGKLRTFLLASFDNHIHTVHRDKNAHQRGGRLEIVSLDELQEAEREALIPDEKQRTPEQLFEQQCALALVDASMNLLAEEQVMTGQGEEFSVLRHEMDPRSSPDERGQEALAVQLGLSHDQLRQKLSRLRARFRVLVRKLVRETLHQPTEEQVDAELNALRAALVG
jgi:RNA polymerase sigma-70 factor (ECF subfamily)